MNTLPADITSPTAGAILADFFGPAEHYRLQPARDCSDVRRAWDLIALNGRISHRMKAEDLRLPMDRPEVRDHCARWLARHHGLTVGATAPAFWYDHPSPSPRDSDGAPYREDWPGRWILEVGQPDGTVVILVGPDPECGPDEQWYPDSWRVVPGLLDVTDPAEALALACLAAGGRS